MDLSKKIGMRSFHLLNATQFLGALNDNVFKLLVVYLLINVKGQNEANTILALAGGIFVIPFLLFSSAAGVMADKVSKSSIIVVTKISEVIVMALGTLAVYFQSEIASYGLLFLMGMQSAVFGPSKYGIIPELVETKKVVKANGSLTALTYLAIIVGTFVASFTTDITHKNFLLVSFLCLSIAIIGLCTSLGIRKTDARKSKKKINPLFVYEIYQTLALSYKRPFLLPAIMGSAFFLFIGAYVQLNVIPFAMESLHLNEVGGGYLFLATAIGIAIGARIAGKMSSDKPEIGLSCCSGFLIVLVFFLLSIFSHILFFVVLFLILLGVFGGMFLIPLESFIQLASPDKRRGQIIAASNFLSFACVLLAAFCLYLFNEKFGFTAAGSFALIGVLTFIFNLAVSCRMSAFFFPYFAEKVLAYIFNVKEQGFPKKTSYIVMQNFSLLDMFMMFYLCKNLRVVMSSKPFQRFPWISGIIDTIYMMTPAANFNTTLQRLFIKAQNIKPTQGYILLSIGKEYEKETIISAYKKIFGAKESDLFFVESKRNRKGRKFLKAGSVSYTFRR